MCMCKFFTRNKSFVRQCIAHSVRLSFAIFQATPRFRVRKSSNLFRRKIQERFDTPVLKTTAGFKASSLYASIFYELAQCFPLFSEIARQNVTKIFHFEIDTQLLTRSCIFLFQNNLEQLRRDYARNEFKMKLVNSFCPRRTFSCHHPLLVYLRSIITSNKMVYHWKSFKWYFIRNFVF